MKREHLAEVVNSLVCPETKLPLELVSFEEAERRGGSLIPRADAVDVKGTPSSPVGRTARVMLRQDLQCAYPVVHGIPILLAPEALRPPERRRAADLTQAKYAEAYAEMPFYNEVGRRKALDITRSSAYRNVAAVLGASQAERGAFPNPKEHWLDAVYDCFAQWDAYRHLAPVKGHCVLQLGGTGTHAVKFVLAGASESWAVTPMLGEALCTQALALETGV